MPCSSSISAQVFPYITRNTLLAPSLPHIFWVTNTAIWKRWHCTSELEWYKHRYNSYYHTTTSQSSKVRFKGNNVRITKLIICRTGFKSVASYSWFHYIRPFNLKALSNACMFQPRHLFVKILPFFTYTYLFFLSLRKGMLSSGWQHQILDRLSLTSFVNFNRSLNLYLFHGRGIMIKDTLTWLLQGLNNIMY